jgi:tRNA(Ile)-lysidine synthase TilS/MesJ
MATRVVALSGGKDSTAMALRLLEVEPELQPT